MLLTNAHPPTQQTVGDRVLSRRSSSDRYTLRLANCLEDLRAAQTLRFCVFNLELNEGLEQSFATGLDADPFDDVCDHLLVEERQTREIVGTYRLQTGQKAGTHRGYYSAQEFDLAPFESRRGQIVELGRACVHIQHRNLKVLSLLWKGIASYARERGGRYLIGCSSVTSQDPVAGATLFAGMQRHHLAGLEWQSRPWPAVACPLHQLLEETPKIPKLLAAYLSLGAKICGPPAIDREFKTIDFLTHLDLEALPAATVERFLS